MDASVRRGCDGGGDARSPVRGPDGLNAGGQVEWRRIGTGGTEHHDHRIAAAVAYDFAGAGYEISSGNRWGADQCAMVEQTFNQINAKDGTTGAPLPGKFGIVEPPLKECRTKYTCLLDPASYQISCSPIAAPPAPAPAASIPPVPAAAGPSAPGSERPHSTP